MRSRGHTLSDEALLGVLAGRVTCPNVLIQDMRDLAADRPALPGFGLAGSKTLFSCAT